jgi:hypothetical protein
MLTEYREHGTQGRTIWRALTKNGFVSSFPEWLHFKVRLVSLGQLRLFLDNIAGRPVTKTASFSADLRIIGIGSPLALCCGSEEQEEEADDESRPKGRDSQRDRYAQEKPDREGEKAFDPASGNSPRLPFFGRAITQPGPNAHENQPGTGQNPDGKKRQHDLQPRISRRPGQRLDSGEDHRRHHGCDRKMPDPQLPRPTLPREFWVTH